MLAITADGDQTTTVGVCEVYVEIEIYLEIGGWKLESSVCNCNFEMA